MKYAFVEYGGQVMGIETRCSCFLRTDKQPGELAIEDIIHPGLIYRYVEIPEGLEVVEGMIYSNGGFKENPVAPTSELSDLKARIADLEVTQNVILGVN